MALVDNKAKIQALLNGINALPEAGGGSGGVKTCTVTYGNLGAAGDIFYTSYENGKYTAHHHPVYELGMTGGTITFDVVAGSILFILGNDSDLEDTMYDNAELLFGTHDAMDMGTYVIALRINGDCTIF